MKKLYQNVLQKSVLHQNQSQNQNLSHKNQNARQLNKLMMKSHTVFQGEIEPVIL